MRRLSRLVLLLLLLLLLWAGLDLLYVSVGVEEDQAAAADTIVVLGCPTYENNVPTSSFSACVQARARHAAGLYKRGLSAAVITSGGFTGPPPSEAEAMARVMELEGVPRAAIIVEDRARDTVQNIANSRDVMRERGWRTAILVTEPHHIRRATLIARDAGLEVFPSPAMASPSWHTPHARLQNLLRDTQTLMSYQLNRLFGLAI